MNLEKLINTLAPIVVLPMAALLVWTVLSYPIEVAGVVFWIVLFAFIATVTKGVSDD